MNKTRLKKFLSYYRRYLRLFLTVLVCALIVAGITLVLPMGVRYITKNVLEGSGPLVSGPLVSGGPDKLRQIYAVGAIMVALVLIQTLCSYFVDYQGHALGARIESDMRAELFEHLQKLSFRFYDEQRTGQLMSRITIDLLSLAEFYHHAPEDYLIYSIKFIGAFVILLTINARLTIAVFLFLPVMALFTYVLNKRLYRVFKTSRQRIADVNAQLEDSLAGIRVVKSFANEAVERGKFGAENERFFESRTAIYKSESILWQGMNTLTQLITITVVVLGGASIVNATLGLPDLITFLLYIGSLTEPVQQLSHMTEQLQEGLTGFERFMDILEIEPEIQDAPGAVELGRVHGEVEFRGVSFRYREDHYAVLKNISLRVAAGDYVALVGTSGVGKTTLCSLIPRFYEVSEGAILMDGINIKNIRLDSLRRSVGVVQQDVYLFAGTVCENIRYGRPGATMEEIITAAKKANAHDFILALPDGYDTDIGQRGVKLSGGQKQRLSIARAFLKDPPVLIFDEATSSLDNESEKVVQEALEELARDRTTFVIAHRLSTIRSARRIVVLTENGIEEEGTHAELMARGGTYARLYTLQFGDVTAKEELTG